MLDTHCTSLLPRHPKHRNPYVMIFLEPANRERHTFALRGHGRSTLTMSFDRSTLPLRSLLFLLVSLSFSNPARSATLEDSAKEFARKIAAALPAQGSVSCQVQNISSLSADEAAKIGQTVKGELEDRGFDTTGSSDAAAKLTITLSQNWRDFVWTASVHAADTSETVVLAIPRAKNESLSTSSRVTLHSEKFWEGPQRVLDVVQGAGPGGQTVTVLLQRDKLVVDEPTGKFEIPFAATAARDPMGKLGGVGAGAPLWFDGPAGLCKADLDTRSSPECLAKEGQYGPLGGRYPLMLDGAPEGPAPLGKGMELVIPAVCGGMSQFLATSDRDDTQADTVQLFEIEASGPTAISSELDFPGPVLVLHSALDASRAIVRNLSTGNYEAYRLAISCAQ